MTRDREADGTHYGIRQLKRDLPHLLTAAAEERKRKATLPRAKSCRCENPWLEREDGELWCFHCSRAWKP